MENGNPDLNDREVAHFAGGQCGSSTALAVNLPGVARARCTAAPLYGRRIRALSGKRTRVSRLPLGLVPELLTIRPEPGVLLPRSHLFLDN